MPISKIKLNSTDNLFQNTEFTGTSHVRLPNGTDAQRPGSPATGMLRYNTTNNILEQYTPTGWVGIEAAPTLSSVTLPGSQTSVFDGDVITITGTGFKSGCIVKFQNVSTSVITNADATTFNSSTQVTATVPSGLAEGTYNLLLINPSGLGTELQNAVSVDGVPSWTTASGSLGNFMEQTALSVTVEATEDGAPVTTFALQSGALPTGVTLNTSTGVISGTPAAVEGGTTYSFTIRATDSENQHTDRSFTLYVENNNAPVWISAAGTIATVTNGTSMTPVTLSAEDGDAGYTQTMSYAVTTGSLPTGLSLNSSTGQITGTPTGYSADTTVTFTVTASDGIDETAREFSIIVITPDPNFNQTVLLVDGEGTNGGQNNTFVDSSSNNFTVVRQNFPVQGSFSPYSPSGWSYQFPETGNNYLTYSASSNYNFGTSDFTVECWYYHDAKTVTESQRRYLVHTESTWGGTQWILYTSYTGNVNKFLFYTYPTFSTNGGQPFLVSSSTLQIGNWYHLALTRSGNTFRLFINGALEATGTSSTSVGDSSYDIFVGGGSTQTDRGLSGSVSNLHITREALYTSAFTPSEEEIQIGANTVLLTAKSSRFVDVKGTSSVTVGSGTPKVTNFSPFPPSATYDAAVNTGSIDFQTSGTNYLTVTNSGSSSEFDFGTGNFTIESWFYSTPSRGAYDRIVAGGSDSDGNNQQWFLGFWPGAQINFGFRDGGSYLETAFNAGSIPNYAWHHVAIVRSSGIFTCYFNGTSIGTWNPGTSKEINTGSYGITVGTRYYNQSVTELWRGSLSNLRITKGTAVYTGNFTVPTSPLSTTQSAGTNIAAISSGVSLLLHGNNSAIVDHSAKTLIETVGSSQVQHNQKKYGTGSVYIPGGSYLIARERNIMEIRSTSDSFTFETWIYPLSIAASGPENYRFTSIISKGLVYLSFGFTSTGVLRFYMYTGSQNYVNSSSGVITTNTWQHVAVSCNAGSIKLFKDGVEVASGTLVVPSDAMDAFPKIGHADTNNASDAFNGYMDDIRYTKGVARYTSNFTPPTAALKKF